jgi:hypothetical protein
MFPNVNNPPYPGLSTPHQLNLTNKMAALRTSQPRPPHCGLIATAIRGATDAEPDVDIHASDASDKADNVNASTSISSRAKYSIFDKSDESPANQPSVPGQPDHELHKLMARLTLSNSDREEEEFSEADWDAISTFEAKHQLLITNLGLKPTPFRRRAAITCEMDENGNYILNNSTPVKCQKIANFKSCGVIIDGDYVNVHCLPVAEGAQGKVEADNTDSLRSSPVLVGDNDSDSDSFSDIVLD